MSPEPDTVRLRAWTDTNVWKLFHEVKCNLGLYLENVGNTVDLVTRVHLTVHQELFMGQVGKLSAYNKFYCKIYTIISLSFSLFFQHVQ